jgi:hypothetical protein
MPQGRINFLSQHSVVTPTFWNLDFLLLGKEGVLYCIVFIFHPKNHCRMISDTSKKEGLQKRETERENERKKVST